MADYNKKETEEQCPKIRPVDFKSLLDQKAWMEMDYKTYELPESLQAPLRLEIKKS